MADAVVSMALDRLKVFLIDEAKFLSGVGEQVEHAQIELLLMQGFLKDADAKQGDNEVVRIWVRIIRDAAYDLEDVLESFALKVASKRGGNVKLVLRRFACILNEGVNLHKVGSEIETITAKLSKLRLSLQSYDIKEVKGTHQEDRQTYSHVIDRDVVGLGEEAESLAKRLVDGEKRHRVVSIWGMGGSGKTTLAKEVYHQKIVRSHFDSFAWVCVSQQCRERKVLEAILIQLSGTNKQTEEIAKMTMIELAEKLCDIQRDRKCLVVLDDIWNCDSWDILRAGFPRDGIIKSQILLTSRNNEVASYADAHAFRHQSRPLNTNESWEIFKKIAFFGGIINPESEIELKKEKLGKEMVEHCAGLPLAITVLAGLLARKVTVEEWNAVGENVDVYIGRGTNLEQEYTNDHRYAGVSCVLALSYDDLPYRLKLCFLYLAHFPEDYDIPVNGLTKLWIAEGFISSASAATMEDASYRCLTELVGRCMVQVGKLGSTGKIKTCRLHDLMRDLCVDKAKDGNFLHMIKSSAGTVSSGKVLMCRIRRLAIYFDKKVDNLAPKTEETDAHLRSLLYFGRAEFFSKLDIKSLRSLFKDFELLRVLKLEGMLLAKLLPKEIGNLIHLRFLSLKDTNVEELPPSVANLTSLQTLDLRIRAEGRYMKIPSLFSKTEQLRHLYFPFNYRASKKLPLPILAKLQTLVNVRIEPSDVKDLAKLTNLRKVIVTVYDHGEIGELASEEFNHLKSLSVSGTRPDIVSKLASTCPDILKLRLQGDITELSEGFRAFLKLTKLTLCGYLPTQGTVQMLEKLPELRLLFLHDSTTSGGADCPGRMDCSRGGFPQLEFLSLCRFEILTDWRVERGAMPSLQRLHIEGCTNLNVPDGLKYISTLEQLTKAHQGGDWESVSISNLREELRAEVVDDAGLQASL